MTLRPPLPDSTGPLPVPVPPRSPWQLLYGAAHRARQRFWARRARALPVPVISIGNLHWGGGGKTPLVAAIAARLAAGGRRPAILSRGWGRSTGRSVRVVSDGRPRSSRLGAREAGDEPALLAELVPSVPVVVGGNRHRAGLRALAELTPRPEIFLLDDGFSHLRLRRDLDILALPASDPFGGARLWPGGRLREPLAAARRAHGAVLTGLGGGAEVRHENEATAPTGLDVARALAPFGFAGRGFVSWTRAEPARTFAGAPLPAGTRVLLVAAIARPEAFAATAAARGVTIVGRLFFPDHHDYPATSLERIAAAAAACGAESVLVTSKDAVKLRPRAGLPGDVVFAELPIHAEPEAAFWTWLEERL